MHPDLMYAVVKDRQERLRAEGAAARRGAEAERARRSRDEERTRSRARMRAERASCPG